MKKLTAVADFMEKRKLRRATEAKTTAQIIEEARVLFQSDGPKEFFRKFAEMEKGCEVKLFFGDGRKRTQLCLFIYFSDL